MATSGERWVCEKSKDPEAIIQADDNHTFPSQSRTQWRPFRGALHISATVHPHHDRQLRGAMQVRRPHIQVETGFIGFHFLNALTSPATTGWEFADMPGRSLSLLEFPTMWEEVAEPSNANAADWLRCIGNAEKRRHMWRAWSRTHDPCSVPALIFICGAAVCAHRRREHARKKTVAVISANTGRIDRDGA